MKRKNVLVMVSPMSFPRTEGIARYAREHDWNLMIQDRLGYHPLAWNGDGVIATIRSDPVTFSCISRLMKRGVPVVDLTISRPDVAAPRVTSDHTAIGRLAAETGYCSPSHLANTFRDATGVSPRAWRNQL